MSRACPGRPAGRPLSKPVSRPGNRPATRPATLAYTDVHSRQGAFVNSAGSAGPREVSSSRRAGSRSLPRSQGRHGVNQTSQPVSNSRVRSCGAVCCRPTDTRLEMTDYPVLNALELFHRLECLEHLEHLEQLERLERRERRERQERFEMARRSCSADRLDEAPVPAPRTVRHTQTLPLPPPRRPHSVHKQQSEPEQHQPQKQHHQKQNEQMRQYKQHEPIHQIHVRHHEHQAHGNRHQKDPQNLQNQRQSEHSRHHQEILDEHQRIWQEQQEIQQHRQKYQKRIELEQEQQQQQQQKHQKQSSQEKHKQRSDQQKGFEQHHQIPRSEQHHQMPRSDQYHQMPRSEQHHQVPRPEQHHQMPRSEQSHQMPRSEQHHQISRSEQSHQMPRSEQHHQISRSEQPHQMPRSEQHHQIPRSEQPHQIPRSEQHHQIPRSEQPHQMPRSEQHHQIPRSEQPHQMPRSEQHHQIPRCEQYHQTQRHEKPHQISVSDQHSQAQRSEQHQIQRTEQHQIQQSEKHHQLQRADQQHQIQYHHKGLRQTQSYPPQRQEHHRVEHYHIQPSEEHQKHSQVVQKRQEHRQVVQIAPKQEFREIQQSKQRQHHQDNEEDLVQQQSRRHRVQRRVSAAPSTSATLAPTPAPHVTPAPAPAPAPAAPVGLHASTKPPPRSQVAAVAGSAGPSGSVARRHGDVSVGVGQPLSRDTCALCERARVKQCALLTSLPDLVKTLDSAGIDKRQYSGLFYVTGGKRDPLPTFNTKNKSRYDQTYRVYCEAIRKIYNGCAASGSTVRPVSETSSRAPSRADEDVDSQCSSCDSDLADTAWDSGVESPVSMTSPRGGRRLLAPTHGHGDSRSPSPEDARSLGERGERRFHRRKDFNNFEASYYKSCPNTSCPPGCSLGSYSEPSTSRLPTAVLNKGGWVQSDVYKQARNERARRSSDSSFSRGPASEYKYGLPSGQPSNRSQSEGHLESRESPVSWKRSNGHQSPHSDGGALSDWAPPSRRLSAKFPISRDRPSTSKTSLAPAKPCKTSPQTQVISPPPGFNNRSTRSTDKSTRSMENLPIPGPGPGPSPACLPVPAPPRLSSPRLVRMNAFDYDSFPDSDPPASDPACPSIAPPKRNPDWTDSWHSRLSPTSIISSQTGVERTSRLQINNSASVPSTPSCRPRTPMIQYQSASSSTDLSTAVSDDNMSNTASPELADMPLQRGGTRAAMRRPDRRKRKTEPREERPRSATMPKSLSKSNGSLPSTKPPAFATLDRARSPSVPLGRSRSPSVPVNRAKSPTLPVNRSKTPTLSLNRPKSPINRAKSPTVPVNRSRSPTVPIIRSRSPTAPVLSSAKKPRRTNKSLEVTTPAKKKKPARSYQEGESPDSFFYPEEVTPRMDRDRGIDLHWVADYVLGAPCKSQGKVRNRDWDRDGGIAMWDREDHEEALKVLNYLAGSRSRDAARALLEARLTTGGVPGPEEMKPDRRPSTAPKVKSHPANKINYYPSDNEILFSEDQLRAMERLEHQTRRNYPHYYEEPKRYSHQTRRGDRSLERDHFQDAHQWRHDATISRTQPRRGARSTEREHFRDPHMEPAWSRTQPRRTDRSTERETRREAQLEQDPAWSRTQPRRADRTLEREPLRETHWAQNTTINRIQVRPSEHSQCQDAQKVEHSTIAHIKKPTESETVDYAIPMKAPKVPIIEKCTLPDCKCKDPQPVAVPPAQPYPDLSEDPWRHFDQLDDTSISNGLRRRDAPRIEISASQPMLRQHHQVPAENVLRQTRRLSRDEALFVQRTPMSGASSRSSLSGAGGESFYHKIKSTISSKVKGIPKKEEVAKRRVGLKLATHGTPSVQSAQVTFGISPVTPPPDHHLPPEGMIVPVWVRSSYPGLASESYLEDGHDDLGSAVLGRAPGPVQPPMQPPGPLHTSGQAPLQAAHRDDAPYKIVYPSEEEVASDPGETMSFNFGATQAENKILRNSKGARQCSTPPLTKGGKTKTVLEHVSKTFKRIPQRSKSHGNINDRMLPGSGYNERSQREDSSSEDEEGPPHTVHEAVCYSIPHARWPPGSLGWLGGSLENSVEDIYPSYSTIDPREMKVKTPFPEKQSTLKQPTSLSSSSAVSTNLRSAAVEEMVTSERDFVRLLRDIVEGFIREARRWPELFDDQLIEIVFSNVDDILSFQSAFLLDLESRMDWENPHHACFGNVFLNHEKNFRAYAEYCNCHSLSIATVQELCKNPQYQEFFSACKAARSLQGITLDGYLLTPVQRICKYPLQLAVLLKHTHVQHADHEPLQQALRAMLNVALFVNESKRRMETLEKIAAWQMTVLNWMDEDLVQRSTQLIHEGAVSMMDYGQRLSTFHLFLFDEQLIYCKKSSRFFGVRSKDDDFEDALDFRRRTTLEYRGRVCTSSAEVIDELDGAQGVNAKYLIRVDNYTAGHMDHTITFSCPSLRAKLRWLQAFAEERAIVARDRRDGFRFSDAARRAALITAHAYIAQMHKEREKDKEAARWRKRDKDSDKRGRLSLKK